jgi:hypothetical protein
MATCYLNDGSGLVVNTIWPISITVNIISYDIPYDIQVSMIHYLKVKIILGTWHLLNREYGAVV